MATGQEKTYCKYCGKETAGKPYCNKECYHASLKANGHKCKSEELDKLSNKNKCYRCGKELPADWISAYCTACENRWEE